MRTSVLLCLAAAPLLAGCARPDQPAADNRPAVAVTIGRAEMTEIAAANGAGGIVRARSTAVIASRMLAPVAEVHVRPGDQVSQGARLVTLDAREHAANHARALAARAAAMNGVVAAEAEVRGAQASVDLARLTHQRIEALAGKRSATREELDRAVAGLAGAEAALAGAQARSAAAGAARDAAEAAAEAAAISLSYAALVAPFDGVVTERRVDPGSMAAPGVALLTLEGTADLRLDVELDEARAARVRVGDDVEVRVDAVHDDWRPAEVVEIARVDPQSHTFIIKVSLPRDAAIRSGMFGRARYAGASRRTLTVPVSAVLRRGQLTFAFAVEDGLARLRSITVGQAAGDRVEILAGLSDGDQVVLAPAESLADGARITPASSPAPAGGAQ